MSGTPPIGSLPVTPVYRSPVEEEEDLGSFSPLPPSFAPGTPPSRPETPTYASYLGSDDIDEEAEIGSQSAEASFSPIPAEDYADPALFWTEFRSLQQKGDFTAIFEFVQSVKEIFKGQIDFREMLSEHLATANTREEFTHVRRLGIIAEILNPGQEFPRMCQAWGYLKEEKNWQSAGPILQSIPPKLIQKHVATYQRQKNWAVAHRLTELLQ